MTKLKRCPFCGGDASLIQVTGGTKLNPATITNRYIVRCNKCDMASPCFDSNIWQDKNGEVHVDANGAELAIGAWNMRVGDADD